MPFDLLPATNLLSSAPFVLFWGTRIPFTWDHTPLFMEWQKRVKSKDAELCQKMRVFLMVFGFILMRKDIRVFGNVLILKKCCSFCPLQFLFKKL
jgi:hypothetical protein